MILMNKDKSFEKSLEKLREMADRIKSPDMGLEESIKCYEEGMKYYKECHEILENTRQTIEKVTEE